MSTSPQLTGDDREQFLEQPRLLECELMGLRLHELVARLASAGNQPLPAPQTAAAGAALDSVLRDYEPEVLERGLGVLPRSRLQMLLNQPALLWELQELLLGQGGAYWDRVTDALPDAGRIQFSQAAWEERVGATFSRRPKSKSELRGAQTISPAQTSAKRRVIEQWAGRLAALLITGTLLAATLLGVAAGWYRSEMRLAAERREHAKEMAALRNHFDEKLTAVQQAGAGERVAAYCRLLHELSSLPAAEQLVSLPADTLASERDSLPPDEEAAAQREQLPAVEESLVSPSAGEQAIARVIDALRRDAAAYAELTRDARRYLEHPDSRVSHGAAMAVSGAALEKTEN